MYAKIEITGIIEVITGMHIGGSSAFAAIGAVDSPVIRDVRTNMPMIPGSSIKGKMRTLLARCYNDLPVKHDGDADIIKRLFGSAQDKKFKQARLIFSDSILSNKQELEDIGIQGTTEVKFENTINRLTAVANPRQIERVIRGCEFEFQWIYEVDEENKVCDDFEVIREGMALLEYDYLGGHGTRGYGKIRFKDLKADCVIGKMDHQVIERCNVILCGN